MRLLTRPPHYVTPKEVLRVPMMQILTHILMQFEGFLVHIIEGGLTMPGFKRSHYVMLKIALCVSSVCDLLHYVIYIISILCVSTMLCFCHSHCMSKWQFCFNVSACVKSQFHHLVNRELRDTSHYLLTCLFFNTIYAQIYIPSRDTFGLQYLRLLVHRIRMPIFQTLIIYE
jgi:hypothetical protein